MSAPRPAPWLPQVPVTRIVPSYPGTTPGGLDVWTRVFYLQAQAHYCLEVVLPSAAASSSSSSGSGSSSAPSRGPAEGDSGCQGRLANLLYEWTDKASDWPLFQRCRIDSPTLGADMWAAILLKYQLRSSCDVGIHSDRLTLPQRKDEPITSFWNSILSAVTHLEASGRPTSLTTLGDIVKLKTLPLHATWTKDVVPGITSEDEIQAMVYNFGVHLEHKTAETDSSSSGAAAFAAVASQTEAIRLLTEQVASLSATNARSRYARDRNDNDRNDRYRPRDRDRNRHPRQPDTRVCHGCGKPGHVLRNCPTFTDSPGSTDRAFPAAFPAAFLPCALGASSDLSLLWVVDSGASRHYSSIASDFIDLIPRDDLGVVSGIDCPIRGLGNISVSTVNSSGEPVAFTLLDVLYVPDLAQRSNGNYLRLLSVRLAVAAGFCCNFTGARDYLSHSSGLTLDLVRHQGLTWLPVSARNHVHSAAVAPASRDLIHRRCGHLHEAGLLKLDSLGVPGVLGFSKLSPMSFCPDCATAKSTVAAINRRSTRDRDPPHPFHSLALDIWGPVSTPDLSGNRYVLGAVCYTTSAIVGVLLKHKSDAPSAWTEILASIVSLGHKPCRIRIDNDTVLLSASFTAICRSSDITIERTVPYAHWQLARIERQWRTLADGAKALLLSALLHDRFWGYAFLAMIYVRNRSWSTGANCIPYTALHGRNPDLSNLRVFGCPAFVHIDSSQRVKFSAKAWQGIFVGYAFDSPAWLVYNPVTHKVIRSRSVTFDESWSPSSHVSRTSGEPLPLSPTLPTSSNDSGEPILSHPLVDYDDVDNETRTLPQESARAANAIRLQAAEDALLLRQSTNPRSRSERARAQAAVDSVPLPSEAPHPSAALSVISEPNSYKKAMKSPDKDHWLLATNKEFSSLIAKGTWLLVPHVSTMRVIGCSWKYKIKRDSSGAVIKYKARLVARGDMQDLDYASVFAPTVRYTTLRVLLALACYHDLEIEQMDVVTAFLNADVVSDVYMEQPEGYHKPSSSGTRLVCKLAKALYGIREAPRAWNALFSSWLVSYGFSQSVVDPAVFTISWSGLLYILAVYVDDCILVGRDGPFFINFKTAFSARFDIEDLGPAAWLLGCCIVRDRAHRTLTLGQSQYADDILSHFGMSSCHPSPTPMTSKLSSTDILDSPLDTKAFPFSSLIGKLLYCANMTRPDISAAVSYLSRFMSSPTERHWEMAKRVLRYVSGTKDYCLTFTGTISTNLLIWQDSSFADGVDRRSRTGFIAMMSGGPVSWSSKLQHSVALSTAEAEYMALAASAQEVMFLRQLLPTIGCPLTCPTPTYEDNESCISLATNDMTTSRTKHIDIKHHFVRDLIKQGAISIIPHPMNHPNRPTSDMLADILTKFSLPSTVYLKHARRMLSGTYSGPV